MKPTLELRENCCGTFKMHSQENKETTHANEHVRNLISLHSKIKEEIDLSEGLNYILSEIATLLLGKSLSLAEEAAIYSYFNMMADGDMESQNLLVINVLEMLADTPESTSMARRNLTGRALFLFEKVIRSWKEPDEKSGDTRSPGSGLDL